MNQINAFFLLSGTAHAEFNCVGLEARAMFMNPPPKPWSAIRVLVRHTIGKNSDCVMKSEQGALVRGSDPPWDHRVHTKAGDMWQALARRPRKKQLAAGG